ncbi:MAG: enoyl-CoA hydratase/isomerase family protein [Chloroflexi bacterium]|nr:enoyl-CoA hydratase/isomerase family protein [Chloroflexota bacterium]
MAAPLPSRGVILVYENVIVERGPVGHLTLNRPQARNALNGPHMRDILAALRELETAAEVRVIVVKGAGRGFCAGADIHQFLGKKPMEAREHLKQVAEIIETIAKLPKPVIAQVHGFALAGGCGLAAACDLTFAAEDARFGLPEIKIGLWPHTVMAPILRAVPRKIGLEYFFSGEPFDGQEAARIGLANRAVPADQLESTVTQFAETLAKQSPVAMQLGKDAFYTMADMEYFKSLRYLREMITLHTLTDDGQEGPRAWGEKREPQWTGL